MNSRARQLSSASTAAIALRLRPDLSIQPQQHGRERYWVVKDPVAQTYFHLRDEEHAILQMLAGRTSFGEIKRRFEEAFPPLQLSFDHLQAFLARLHAANLLLAERTGQGEELLRRHDRQRWQTAVQFCANLLAIRFRGVDPETWLCRLHPFCRWMFSGWFLAGCLLWVVAAAALAGVHFDVLRSRLPDFHTFFSARNVVWLAVALAMAKILHELGHALTNKHFGGECHEIGILLVLLTPCLYCNVSDAWLLANKWHRIAISAAGIVVELTLAATCTFLWWFSQPGLFNTLCLCVMCVCSVNTLLFNGNPLLRYDGYYILSDLLEIPNLGQQSQRLMARILSRLFLGLKLPRERWLSTRQRVLLTIYAICSTGYRWLVVIAILWFGYRALKPYGLGVLVQTFALFVIAGLAISPVWSLIMFLQNPVYQQRMRKFRAAVAVVALAMLVGAIVAAPLPARVSAPLVLHPSQAHYVYVPVAATLAKTTAAGTAVEKDQILAQLVNLDVRKQIVELTGQRDQQRLQVQNLKRRLAADPSLAPQIPAAEELLADVESRLRQREFDEQRLVLRAPLKGTVLPPPARLDKPYRPGALDVWRGSPLDERNVQSYLETGTLFCLVGDPAALEAYLVVEQADMKFVRKGQRVRMQLDELPGGVLEGTITEIAKTDLRVAPRELAAGNELPVAVDSEGVARPTETSYQARVSFDRALPGLLLGDRGRAKILVEPQSLWQRGRRYLEATFNFKL